MQLCVSVALFHRSYDIRQHTRIKPRSRAIAADVKAELSHFYFGRRLFVRIECRCEIGEFYQQKPLFYSLLSI